MIEYRTTVQPLWRDATSEHFQNPGGIYHAPTAPLVTPVDDAVALGADGVMIGADWSLHSVVPLALFGEPKLLVVWAREIPDPAYSTGTIKVYPKRDRIIGPPDDYSPDPDKYPGPERDR